QTLYDVFIDKVAEGRNMDSEEVRAIAEGRIWTGEQAVQNGLADGIGGLLTAVSMARDKAGIGPGEEIEYYQGPALSSFALTDIILPESNPETGDPLAAYLELLIEHNGRPLHILPLRGYQLYYQLMMTDQKRKDSG
ncbi:MAG: S49 family peptidase, partial [Balneolales bacterium]